ncbi:MAG: hypothetical protein K2K00_11220 [Muribaculaceae bacterium]|nr:hypothetical protein [Muribaculaceae bacterium]MDE6704230.1 hypothetical protein [Muribaculaceae bacterium]
MKKTFRMTSGELVSLSVVAIVVGAVIVGLIAKDCSGSERYNERDKAICDSVTSVIENQAVKKDSTVKVDKTKHKKTSGKTKTVKPVRLPKQRNYLDEPANE